MRGGCVARRIASGVLAAIALAAIAPFATAQTQAEMNKEARAQFDASDRRMNRTYKELNARLSAPSPR